MSAGLDPNCTSWDALFHRITEAQGVGFLSLTDLCCLDVCLGAGWDTKHQAWFWCHPREEMSGVCSRRLAKAGVLLWGCSEM